MHYLASTKFLQKVAIRTKDGVERVEVKEGLGDAYIEDADTFDIMNEEQIAFNSFYTLSSLIHKS